MNNIQELKEITEKLKKITPQEVDKFYKILKKELPKLENGTWESKINGFDVKVRRSSRKEKV